MSETKQQSHPISTGMHLNVTYMGTAATRSIIENLPSEFTISHTDTLSDLHKNLSNQSILSLPDVILIETDPNGKCFEFIEKIKKNPLWRELIIVLIDPQEVDGWKARALKLKVHDYYVMPFPIEHLIERLSFLVKFKLIKPSLSILEKEDIVYKLPLGKRMFDLFIASLAILLTTPVLIITAIIVKLDSPGPIIYKSKRVGTGYRIFNFYKFRSMYTNADQRLGELSELNLYKAEDENQDDSQKKAAFVKLADDPRITKFGHFIRRTSIDELPQLFNVLNGDMSLVGNRPLPLYEAEMLTSNEWSMRFMGPAGVTGLWQIKSRGKRDISERERKKFDNFYASKYSFWFDLEILIKTIPVILHKEKF